ncbi:hypothetical protein B0H11DRAFT_1901496 [Mycena galericulata]|nr:hypothetical protein B0H11DRAFT_1901496 [Mycena galericulata]
MEKVYLGVLANATEPRVQLAVRGLLDFTHYAHFETHCDESLGQMDAAWAAFHANKAVFIDLGICEHFNINKLHKLKHYTDASALEELQTATTPRILNTFTLI